MVAVAVRVGVAVAGAVVVGVAVRVAGVVVVGVVVAVVVTMSAMKRLEETIMHAPMADLAFIFQRRLLEQDAINTINHETLASIANSIDRELINRMALCEESHD